MCLHESYSRVRVVSHLSDVFSIRNGLKQGDALSPLLFKFALELRHYKVSGQPGWLEVKWYTSASSWFFGVLLISSPYL